MYWLRTKREPPKSWINQKQKKRKRKICAHLKNSYVEPIYIYRCIYMYVACLSVCL